ncbi:MAG: ABC transporter substrate-binding protein [Verrucomicrobia bacterium]|nr:ABC transporter substrate-binding protein [Verrucomicrobiota bacterium]
MKKTLIAVVVAGAVIAGALIWRSGTTSPRHEKLAEVIIPLEGDIQTLDPAALSDPITSRVVWQIYEGLVGLNEKNEVTPMLAESWHTSEGGKKWSFRLRENAFFHRNPVFVGEKQTRVVKASDVVFSYERLARGFGSFVFQGLIEGFDEYVKKAAPTITGITTAGDREVTFTLTRPDLSFLYRITTPYLAIMAPEVLEANKEQFGRTVAVGTGPFRLTTASPTEITLERHPDYWRPTTGNVQRVVFRVEKNPQLRVAAFRAGNYSLMQLPFEFRSDFLDQGKLRPELSGQLVAFEAATFNVHYLGMDSQQLRDPKLRHAISIAIDRDTIAKKLLAGGAIPARGPVPPGMQGYEPPVNLRTDLAAAKKEVAESSYGGEELVLLVSSLPNHADVAQVVQSNLLTIGIKSRIDLVDLNTLVSRLFSKERPPLFMASSDWIYAAPELIMDVFKRSAQPNPNLFGYSDDRAEALFVELAKANDRAQINRLCAKIETIAAAGPPAAWLYHVTNFYVGQRYVSNLQVTGNNHWLLAELRTGQ